MKREHGAPAAALTMKGIDNVIPIGSAAARPKGRLQTPKGVKMKLTKDGDLESDDVAIIRRDSQNAVAAVNTYRFTALRMMNYGTWPDAGEIRKEIDVLDKLPLYELHELMDAAGFQHD